jgi:hypothetical protein
VLCAAKTMQTYEGDPMCLISGAEVRASTRIGLDMKDRGCLMDTNTWTAEQDLTSVLQQACQRGMSTNEHERTTNGAFFDTS